MKHAPRSLAARPPGALGRVALGAPLRAEQRWSGPVRARAERPDPVRPGMRRGGARRRGSPAVRGSPAPRRGSRRRRRRTPRRSARRLWARTMMYGGPGAGGPRTCRHSSGPLQPGRSQSTTARPGASSPRSSSTAPAPSSDSTETRPRALRSCATSRSAYLEPASPCAIEQSHISPRDGRARLARRYPLGGRSSAPRGGTRIEQSPTSGGHGGAADHGGDVHAPRRHLCAHTVQVAQQARSGRPPGPAGAHPARAASRPATAAGRRPRRRP